MKYLTRRLAAQGKGLRLAGMALLLAAALPAAADVAVVVSAKNATASLTKEQVSDLFLGKAASFPGGGAVSLADLPESSPLREEFYNKVSGKSASQVKSYWVKMAFTGKGTPPKEMAGSSEVKKAVAGDPSLIGYIDKSAVDGSVKVLFTAR